MGIAGFISSTVLVSWEFHIRTLWAKRPTAMRDEVVTIISMISITTIITIIHYEEEDMITLNYGHDLGLSEN